MVSSDVKEIKKKIINFQDPRFFFDKLLEFFNKSGGIHLDE